MQVQNVSNHLKVYDGRQDKEKGLFRKMYEGMIGGISGLLENRPRAEVATKIPITGDIEAPQTSTWEMVVRLIQNAFFKAILPGFEKEVSGQGTAAPKSKPLVPKKPAPKPPDVATEPQRGPG